MREVFSNPVVWGSILAFLGVIVGHFTTNYGKEKDRDLETLRASVTVLQSEYSRLTAEVKELREAMEKSEKRNRRSLEKYSALMAWAGAVLAAWDGLKVRLQAVGFSHGEIPPLPATVEADLPILPVSHENNSEDGE